MLRKHSRLRCGRRVEWSTGPVERKIVHLRQIRHFRQQYARIRVGYECMVRVLVLQANSSTSQT